MLVNQSAEGKQNNLSWMDELQWVCRVQMGVGRWLRNERLETSDASQSTLGRPMAALVVQLQLGQASRTKVEDREGRKLAGSSFWLRVGQANQRATIRSKRACQEDSHTSCNIQA